MARKCSRMTIKEQSSVYQLDGLAIDNYILSVVSQHAESFEAMTLGSSFAMSQPNYTSMLR